jgi:hypothetical protein
MGESNMVAPKARRPLKKNVAHIHMSGDLSLLERKIVNIMLLNAYDDLLTKTVHTIPVPVLLDLLGWGQDGGVENLKAALENIVRCVITFDVLNKSGKKKAWQSMALLAGARIEGGVCSYQYAQFLAEELANPEIYATINVGIQNEFSSSYALTLWENCVRFKNVGSTGWIGVDTWRQLLGADAPRYDTFKHLSNEVIKKSVEEVNKVSDIEIEPEYRRELRRVKDIRFSVKAAVQQSLFGAESVEDSVRESPIFKSLLEVGIGEKLALVWVIQDPERAARAVEHVQAIDRERQLENPAGYLRTVYESGGAIGNDPARAEARAKKAAAKSAAELAQNQASVHKEQSEAARARAITKLINALEPEQLHRLASQYVGTEGVNDCKSYDEETGEFKVSLERAMFKNWLRTWAGKQLPK